MSVVRYRSQVQAQGVRVVTPEAVVLDVRTAGLGSRSIARVLDGLIQGAALFVVFLASVFIAAGRGVSGLIVALVLFTVILIGYPIAWETLWRGRTPGKAALGLRVVTKEGAPIRFRHAVVRGVLGLGEVTMLPVIGVLALLVSKNEQRLGDMAAGTIVIRERATGPRSAPVVFYPPPGWEGYVDTLDVGGMTAAEYETVRAFLLRAAAMAPAPRYQLAVRLAGPLASRLHQPVPSSAGPDLWLACVAAAYQRRHGGPWGASPAGWGPGPAGWGTRPEPQPQLPAQGGWAGPPPVDQAVVGSRPPPSDGFTPPT